MSKRYLFAILLFRLLMTSLVMSAQADSSGGRTTTSFKIGVYFNSRLNYFGRTDSLESSGIFPLAELSTGNGFYLNAAPVFINNAISSMEYAGTVATAGYRSSESGKVGAHFYIVKPFYKHNSQLVQSALEAQFATILTTKTRMVNINLGGDIKLSDNLDYGAAAGVDRAFRLKAGKGTVIAIVPMAYAHAGTQRFSKTYYKKSNFLLFPGVEQEVTEDVNRFRILAYEFSMPMVLAIGKFQLLASPAYSIPKNLIRVEGQPSLSETGENLFYITVGANFNF